MPNNKIINAHIQRSKQFAENDAKAKATDKKTKDAAKVQIHEEL